MISKNSEGVNVPYFFGAECYWWDITITGSLIGTKFKFTIAFVNSYWGQGYSNWATPPSGPQEPIILKWIFQDKL